MYLFIVALEILQGCFFLFVCFSLSCSVKDAQTWSFTCAALLLSRMPQVLWHLIVHEDIGMLFKAKNN